MRLRMRPGPATVEEMAGMFTKCIWEPEPSPESRQYGGFIFKFDKNSTNIKCFIF